MSEEVTPADQLSDDEKVVTDLDQASPEQERDAQVRSSTSVEKPEDLPQVSETGSPQSAVSGEELSTSETDLTSNNEARLEQLEKEHETLRSQYMRIAADFDNFRKRQSRDQDDLKLQLICNTLSEILPVVDNFERARQQLDPQGEEAQSLHRSYQGLYKQLVEVLKQLGVAPMRVVGQTFDPTLHEAVLREPSEEQAEDVITEELQRGYHLNGRVLRHALVKVSIGPGPSSTDGNEPIKLSDEIPNNGDKNTSPLEE